MGGVAGNREVDGFVVGGGTLLVVGAVSDKTFPGECVE